MSSITRAVIRASKNWPSGARGLLIGVLGVALAVGVVAVLPTKAFAATELRAPLALGANIPAPLVAYGPNLVVGAHRSTNSGGAWTSDETLTTMSETGAWTSSYNSIMYGISGTKQAVTYGMSGGSTSTYQLPADDVWTQGNSAWVMSTTTTGGAAYNFLNGVGTAVSPPTGSVVYGSLSGRLGVSSNIVWHATGSGTGSHSLFSIAPTPTDVPSPWVTIDGVKDWSVSVSQFVYTLDTPTGVQLCTRPLTNIAATPACLMVVAGARTSYGADVYLQGATALVALTSYDTGAKSWYIATGTTSSAAVQLPTGSSIDIPFEGDTAYVVVRDASSVPSMKKVNADGSLSAGPANPSQAVSSIESLAVAPDRIAGADDRDASSVTFPAWSRAVSVSSTVFGSEVALPKRASGLAVSAGRTALSSSDGLTMLDRGTAGYTFSDAHLQQISGSYVSQRLFDASFSPYVQVSKVDGTSVARFSTWAGALFGSRYRSFAADADPAGATRVTTTELNSGVTDPVVALAAGSAACSGWVAWNDLVAGTCDSGHAVRVYHATTGALVRSTSSSSVLLSVTEVGDGYALLYGDYGSQLLNLATGDVSQLVDCTTSTVSDGVGHVVCASRAELIWRNYSSLATSAGRVLGWSAPSIFSSAVTTWTPEIDVSKPFNAGTLTILQNSVPVRVLTVPASADGSVRGVPWNGKNDAGVLLKSGTFTAELAVTGADGSGPVKAIDGASAPSFQLSRATPGSFTALSPSRLLDTRDGTGMGVAGAVAAGGVVDLQVTDRGGVPATGVGAVVLNVTVVTPVVAGYVTVYPSGTPAPLASNLNFTPGQVVPNLVVAKVGAGGKVSIKNGSAGFTHLVADVAGYFVGGPVTDPGGVTAVDPYRLLDSRVSGGALPALGSRTVQTSGLGNVPAGVSAVVVNVTAVTPQTAGYLSVYPSDGAVPTSSNVNFVAGQVVPNLAFVKVAADGSFVVRNGSAGAMHVVVDVAGYVLGGSVAGSGMFVPVNPTRALDTRPAYGGSGPVAAYGVKTLPLAGTPGLPAASGLSGVVVNVTVVSGASPGYLTVYPADATQVPLASNLNFRVADAVPNLVAAKTSASGAIAIYNGSASPVHVIVDIAGYFTS
ncbi:MAG: hypothetical protein ACOH16_04810 [Propionibacteriaceae bacterium]